MAEERFIPRLIAWEITRRCNLTCIHCRAAALSDSYADELSSQECFRLLDDVASFSSPIIILTGGDPLLRPDVFDIAQYATNKGLRVVLSTNGTTITREKARRMVEVGIKRISISLDGSTAESHDRVRDVEGAFAGALRGIDLAKEAGLEIQINTTITKQNLAEIEKIQELAVDLGAASHHIFLLVPTGRGKNLVDQALTAQEYEETLNWFYRRSKEVKLYLKATCAPHYYRIIRQQAKREGRPFNQKTFGMEAMTKGCLGGQAFAFISHRGKVQICGYLEVEAGDIREDNFSHIWYNSPLFRAIREVDGYQGRCGRCEYRRVCGGCRARAYAFSGDYLQEDPFCAYQPRQVKTRLSAG